MKQPNINKAFIKVMDKLMKMPKAKFSKLVRKCAKEVDKKIREDNPTREGGGG